MSNATIDKSKPVSLEAMKFLGLPFTWGSCNWACKFVHTNTDVVIYERKISETETEWRPGVIYPREETIIFELERGEGLKVWRMTFPDDAVGGSDESPQR